MGLPFILPTDSPFEAYFGCDFNKVLQYKQDVADVLTPVNITGWSFEGAIREKYGSAAPLIEMTTLNGALPLVDATTGKFAMVLTDTQCRLFTTIPLTQATPATIPYKDYVFDIVAIKPNGDTIPFIKGVLRVYAQVTRE